MITKDQTDGNYKSKSYSDEALLDLSLSKAMNFSTCIYF